MTTIVSRKITPCHLATAVRHSVVQRPGTEGIARHAVDEMQISESRRIIAPRYRSSIVACDIGSSRYARGDVQPAGITNAAITMTPRDGLPRRCNIDYQVPVLGIEIQGSSGAFAPPRCSNSMEIPSGERTKAIRPSRGGLNIVTPWSIRRRHVA